jgi:outer membrane receptor protein involved in Fe transport
MVLGLAVALLQAAGQTRMAIGAGVDTTAVSQQVDSIPMQAIGEVTVTSRRPGMSRVAGAENTMRINRAELFKAACCNLGESFTTNPSVDVNYSDAATGAKQIKLLGLSGTYVQMLAENLPNWRGAALPYALGYVPGPWMKSIQVSKGASTVRNGYEGITGQIDVEYLKPEDAQGVTLNLYGNSDGRIEANADGNLHLTPRLNANVLAHYEDNLADMDHNHDHFLDQPNVRQVNLQNRWDWLGDRYIFHGGVGMIDEKRHSGQTQAHHQGAELFAIDLKTRRYEGYMKHAVFLNAEHDTNIAMMATVANYDVDGNYGHKRYNVNETNAYGQLMFETTLGDPHTLSLGLSVNHDYLSQDYRLEHNVEGPLTHLVEKETVTGAYGQYTFTPASDVLTLMAGGRVDHSSLHGTFVTPRLHLRLHPAQFLTVRLSAGKGYRTAHALAENHYMLASGRRVVFRDLNQESAWNYGFTTAWDIPLWGKLLKVNAEYHYTHFVNQMVIDVDSDPLIVYIHDLEGKSRSHTWQVDVSYPVVEGLELTVAYRRNDVKTTYGGELREKPLTPRYKGLVAASYKTPLGLWEFDMTLQLNGSGRMPDPYYIEDPTQLSWSQRFPAHCQLNAQVTRWFRHFSVYLGGENLTNYRQSNPIIAANQPWSQLFDPTMVWGPVSGAMAYLGIRINLFR